MFVSGPQLESFYLALAFARGPDVVALSVYILFTPLPAVLVIVVKFEKAQASN